jgi:hypothetical protein
MADITLQRNVGALGDLKRLTDHGTSVAGGSGDATSITGLSIDRAGFGNGSLPLSALVSVDYEGTLASGKTLSVGYAVQDSADNSTWADYQTATSAVVSTGASGGSVNKGQFNVQVNLTSARRYVRFNYMPTCSNTQTDTTYSDATGFFAGFDRLASSNA